MPKVLEQFANHNINKCFWKGPHIDGITQSLAGKYFVCKTRFRVAVVDGLRVKEGWNHRLGYGDMWHLCEEKFAAGEDWTKELLEHAKKLCAENITQQEQIEKWYQVCKVQFPVYVKYWQDHPDVIARTPLMQEQEFAIPYRLPSERVVILRGKWDSVDLVKKAINLQENKTKGDVDQRQIERQMLLDMQTMTYIVALVQAQEQGLYVFEDKKLRKLPVSSVRYNVVRRPLSGGRGTIVPHKATKNKCAETPQAYYRRLLDDYIAVEPEYYFTRFNVSLSLEDVMFFEHKVLQPLLENIADDYEWWSYCKTNNIDEYNYLHRASKFKHHTPRDLITPFGIYNTIAEGGSTDLDNYILTGDATGLAPVETLFPELDVQLTQ